VADATYEFTIADVGSNGKQSDRGKFCSLAVFEVLKDKSLNIPPDVCCLIMYSDHIVLNILKYTASTNDYPECIK
jgi:hypothetical protein